MQKVIFGNEQLGKDICLAFAIEMGYTHVIKEVFTHAEEAYAFYQSVREDWGTNMSPFTFMHRRVYGLTVATQYVREIAYPQSFEVSVLIAAGRDFSTLLANQPVGRVQPLKSSLIKQWSPTFEDDDDEELSLMPSKKANQKRLVEGRYERI